MSKYYSPKELFSNFPNLAPTFAENRYQYNPSNESISYRTTAPNDWNGNPNFYPNMAAMEIYNVNNPSVNPIIKGMRSEKLTKGDTSNYGHSEPRLMRYGLDTLIKQNPTTEVIAPSQNVRDRNNIESESLYNLVRNPSNYKRYLENQGKRLNMLSERPFCNPSNGEGCSQFMKNISPDGSEFGHTVQYTKNYGNTMQAVKDVEKAYNSLGPVYLDYMRSRKSSKPNAFQSPVKQNPLSQLMQSPIANEYSSRNVVQGFESPMRTPPSLPQLIQSPVKQNPLSQLMQSPIANEYSSFSHNSPEKNMYYYYGNAEEMPASYFEKNNTPPPRGFYTTGNYHYDSPNTNSFNNSPYQSPEHSPSDNFSPRNLNQDQMDNINYQLPVGVTLRSYKGDPRVLANLVSRLEY
jgi:hypothetical protein